MKILHVINNLGSGGAEKLIEQTLPLLNRVEGVKADVLLLTDEKNVFLESLIQKYVKVGVVKYKNIYDPRNIFEIKRYIIEGNYDIVHAHLFPTQYWVGIASWILKSKNIRFITTEHSTHNRRRDKRYLRFIDKLIYNKYDSIISITEKTKDNLISWIDNKQEKIDKHIIIGNGVNTREIRKALSYKKTDLIEMATEDTKLICMVGRFSEAKDQPTLIKAIKRLSPDVHLLLIGEGHLVSDNKALVKKIGITDRVHFLGFRDDVFRILKTIDICVLSSNWEGFGLAAVEGMASGKPVIASNISGLKEVVKGAGILFEQGNEKELAEKINTLLQDEEYSKKVVKACLDRANEYDINVMVRKIVEVYKEVIKIH